MTSRIIILGMFRSGTSITARLVQSWGAYAGPESDLFGDRYGYLEHLGLQKLNDELMDLKDRVPPVAELLLERSQDPQYMDRAMQLLDSMDRQAKEHASIAWVWKDPRLPMLLPFWTNLWGNAIYVITVRHPIETI
ncbi:MAG TPA: sulfotransferase, partial [Anaerolineales bacterium]